LRELRENLKLTYMYITHDLNVAKTMSDFVAVMYLGRIVEMASSEELFKTPLHPYTQVLIGSIPRLAHERQELTVLEGEVPSPIDVPRACALHPRCPRRLGSTCDQKIPQLRSVREAHQVACHIF